jgi:hypothetical protein
MPTSLGRGPPGWSLCPRLSAYFESRHSARYADVGIRDDIIVIAELFETDRAPPPLLDDFPLQELPHLRSRS